jgi:NADH:ubiquinone oxidoreductase subunit 4 (subunit M)
LADSVPLGVQEASTAIIVSVVGIVYASLLPSYKRFKRLIAIRQSHVGLIAAGALTLGNRNQGAMIQMLSHGILVFVILYYRDNL